MKKMIFAAIMLLAPLTMSAQKFGHFNSTELVPLLPEYVTAQSELQNLAKQYEDDLKRMQDELQKKGEEFQKEQANLLDNVRQRRQAELEDLYQRMQQSVQDNQQAYQKAQAGSVLSSRLARPAATSISWMCLRASPSSTANSAPTSRPS